MSFSDQEIEEFKTEAIELLDVAEKSLLALDLGSEFKLTYDAVFRSFHNLKGAAGMMEMQRLQAHTHELESILMPFKDRNEMPKNYVSFFLNGIDAPRSILDGNDVHFNYQGYLATDESSVEANGGIHESILAVETSGPPVGVVVMSEEQGTGIDHSLQAPTDSKNVEVASKSALAEFVAESEEVLVRVSNNLEVLEKGQASRDVIDELYRDIHSLKGTSYLFGFQQMGDIGHAMESAMEPVRDGTHSASRLLIDGLYKAIEALELDLECTKAEISNDQLKALAPTLVKVLTAAGKSLPLAVAASAPVPTTAPVVESSSEKAQVELAAAP